MDVIAMMLLGLAMGAAFGFALEKGRVFEPGVIVGQMQFRSFTMLKMFLAAVITGLAVLAVLNGLWGVKLHPKATEIAADLVGGGLLGVGIALAGACPGTVFAQIGAGYRDAWFTLAGGLAGAIAFGYAEPALRPLITGGPGKLTFDALLGLPFWAVAATLAAILAGALVLLEKAYPWRDELGPEVDGLRD